MFSSLFTSFLSLYIRLNSVTERRGTFPKNGIYKSSLHKVIKRASLLLSEEIKMRLLISGNTCRERILQGIKKV
jgi:hypothetical protein